MDEHCGAPPGMMQTMKTVWLWPVVGLLLAGLVVEIACQEVNRRVRREPPFIW